MLPARYDDDDDDDIYIYIYICVCVCVYIYIYMCILFGPVKPESGIIPSGQKIIQL